MCIKQCCSCILNESIPDVEIYSNGLCNYCNEYETNEFLIKRMNKVLLNKMEKLFNNAEKSMYDAIIMFSGGKDSTMLLKVAKEKYHLKPLAISVIHPLVNDIAKKNMDDVARKLKVDLIKVQIQEDIYIKVVRQAIVHGKEYGLSEFVGCDICNFLFMWVAIKLAMRLNIPTILEGSDKSQNGSYFIEGKKVGQKIADGIKPYGVFHNILEDALGDEYEGSIFDCDIEEIRKYHYPNIISPFMFTNYSYENNFNQISEMGLDSKQFRSILTNCDAVPFFSYIAMKRYGCVSYIKHFANEIRNKYPNLSQLGIGNENAVLEKEFMQTVINEYENIIQYVVQNCINTENVKNEQINKLLNMGSKFTEYYGKDVSRHMIMQILKIHYYAEYFDIDLHSLK